MVLKRFVREDHGSVMTYIARRQEDKLNPDYKDTNFGFRCVKDL